MRHILCVHLKNWPINRLMRRDRGLQDKPVAVVDIVRGKQMIVAACKLARAKGVRRGMTLSHARTLCADIVDRPHQPGRDRKALDAFGRWLMRFTPIVSVEGADALLLDVGGCERLFGGFEPLIRQAHDAIRDKRIAAHLTIAPTAAAALAIASCSRVGWQIVDASQLDRTLSPLPVGALRLDPLIVEKLHRVGIDTIGQLRVLPRNALPSRFGPELLHRLDQATGRLPESFVPVKEDETISAMIEFDEPIDSLETVWKIVRELVERVVNDLNRRGSGARRLLLRLHQAYDAPIEQVVSLACASCDPRNLFNLLNCSLESLQAKTGFRRFDLDVTLAEKLSPQQITLHGQAEHDAQVEWRGLIERLQARLGPDAVLRPRWVESHLPEQACVYQPATADAPDNPSLAVQEIKPLSPRPLCLFERPVEIAVMVSPSEDREGHPIAFTYRGKQHRLRFAVGPERIAGPWWNGNHRTRDYFEVEDEIGLRFWLFRVLETWRWYLHGRFE